MDNCSKIRSLNNCVFAFYTHLFLMFDVHFGLGLTWLAVSSWFLDQLAWIYTKNWKDTVFAAGRLLTVEIINII